MAIYLDPKADLTFKKVFGEHKELMISFLNAMLPLPDNGQVEWIEYLEPELIPDHPLKRTPSSTCAAATRAVASFSLRCR